MEESVANPRGGSSNVGEGWSSIHKQSPVNTPPGGMCNEPGQSVNLPPPIHPGQIRPAELPGAEGGSEQIVHQYLPSQGQPGQIRQQEGEYQTPGGQPFEIEDNSGQLLPTPRWEIPGRQVQGAEGGTPQIVHGYNTFSQGQPGSITLQGVHEGRRGELFTLQ